MKRYEKLHFLSRSFLLYLPINRHMSVNRV